MAYIHTDLPFDLLEEAESIVDAVSKAAPALKRTGKRVMAMSEKLSAIFGDEE